MPAMKAVDPRVSFAELSAWPDDGRWYELYGGEPIVVPAPNWRHQRVVVALVELLAEYERRCGGAVVAAPFDIVLSDYDVLQPDVVFFGAAKRAQIDPLQAAYVVPDLVVEVLSRNTEVRDRGRKMALLAGHGLPEYWLIDPGEYTLEIYTSRAGRMALSGMFARGDRAESTTLSGLHLDIDRLFA